VSYDTPVNVTTTSNSAVLFDEGFTPPFDLPGTWKLRCSSTVPNVINSNEVTVTVNEPLKPDLTVTSVSLDRTSVQAGGSINVTYTMKNLGPASSTGTSLTGFYLGNTQNGAQNFLYETSAVSITTVNGTTTLSARGTIPENTLPGNYFLVVYADHNNQIAESNEGNNTNGTPLTVFKFEVTGISLTTTTQATINTGGAVTTSGNISGTGSGTVSVQYEYLKPNTTTWLAYDIPFNITMTNNSAL
jgi:subtilase family serine protease